ncbi:MAG: HAD family hydrolase [Bacteroidota bacterium]
MKIRKPFKIIAFDADDTLWINEPHYGEVEHQVENLLKQYLDAPDLKEQLYAREKVNLKLFGYGAKGFVLSLIETAIELTDSKISAADIHQIISWGKDMLTRPIEVLEGVENVLHELEEDYALMLLTKGDLFDQESKLARSNLARYFTHVEIVSEKNEQVYQGILDRYGIAASDLLMVGNSLRSDILPMVEIGVTAIHIPYHTTWVHELVNSKEAEKTSYLEFEQISKVLDWVRS